MDIRVTDIDVDNTKAIQIAINECHNSGGGKVIFNKGKTYRAGRICLCSNVELYFEQNSKLMAVDDINAFSVNHSKDEDKLIETPTWENCDYSGQPNKFFIYAKDCENIGIKGSGIIDGNEEIFYGKVGKYHIDGYFYPRVPLIFFENCQNVNIEDITLQRSAFWTTHLVGCKNVDIHNIKIKNNLKLANCDGIDPDHCQNVKIRNCYIESADDCIVFKTTKASKKYGPCENIEVENCTLISTSAAIKFGTESVSDFKNIYIHDCKIERTNRAIAFQLRDEGNISNICFENIDITTRMFSPIEWWGKAEPIIITAVKRKESAHIGTIQKIVFKNITMKSENGILIFGDESRNISDIKLSNIKLELYNETKWNKNIHDLRPSEKYGIFNKTESYLYVRNAKNIEIDNYTFTTLSLNSNPILDIEKNCIKFL